MKKGVIISSELSLLEDICGRHRGNVHTCPSCFVPSKLYTMDWIRASGLTRFQHQRRQWQRLTVIPLPIQPDFCSISDKPSSQPTQFTFWIEVVIEAVAKAWCKFVQKTPPHPKQTNKQTKNPNICSQFVNQCRCGSSLLRPCISNCSRVIACKTTEGRCHADCRQHVRINKVVASCLSCADASKPGVRYGCERKKCINTMGKSS